MIKKLLGIKKNKDVVVDDPSVFEEHARDENGIIVSAITPADTVEEKYTGDEHYTELPDGIERRSEKDRRTGPKNRRADCPRREKNGFCWRKLIPFTNRRCGLDRRREVPQDRRYGVDRRILKKLSEDELKRLESALPTHITDAFEKPAAQTPQNKTKKEDVVEIHSGISRAPIYDRSGHFIAEAFRKDPLFQESGNNFVEFCNIPNSEMSLIFDNDIDDAMVTCNQGEPCPVGLTKSSNEIIHFIISNPVTIEIPNKVHRHIKLIAKTNSDPTERFIGLANKNEQTYYPVILQLKNVGSNIKRISDSKVRFGDTTVMYDGNQIVDIVDESNHKFRLTGIAGLSNLQKYVEDKAAAEEEAKQALPEEEEEVLETTITSNYKKPEPIAAPDAIVSLDVFGSGEKKIMPEIEDAPPVAQNIPPSPTNTVAEEPAMFAAQPAENTNKQATDMFAPRSPEPAPLDMKKPPEKPAVEAAMFQTPESNDSN